MNVHFHTFGCKANQYDTERMRQALEAAGARTVDGSSAADLCVVNTCTVTNQADADARRYIRRLRRERPDAQIVVTGCSAALRGEAYRRMEGVVGVVEGHDPTEVQRTALAVRGACSALRLVPLIDGRSLDRMDTEPVAGALLRERRGQARGWLKVQDGCDRKCAFCATRLARGASRSRLPEDVVAEAVLLAQRHAELVITGVHIGHYGRDLSPSWTLSRLVALLLDRVPSVRFRLGSIEATEVDDLLLDLLGTSGDALAPHLHMPLQSGSDPVLRRMRRWHTREAYRTRALDIADRLPILGLGADIITGFPGERAEDHATTRALVEELPYTYLHVFPYSPRDGTVAASLLDPVPQRVAGERARELRTLGEAGGRRYRRRRAGQAARVVTEGGSGTALTGDYLRVATRDPRAPGDGAPPSGLWSGTLQWDGDRLYIERSSEEPGAGPDMVAPGSARQTST